MKQFTILILLIGVLYSCAEQKPQMQPPTIPVIKVLKEQVPIEKEFVGQTYGLFDIAIRARVDGFLDKIHFNEGGKVKKGQLLYSIDPAPFDAKVAEAMSKVAEAQTRLAQTKSDYDRYKPLSETNAVSQSDYDAAIANLGAAEAGLEAAQASLRYAKIQQSYTRMYSPINGIIGRSEAKESDYVGMAPNPVVLNTVSRIDTILVRFAISELQYLNLVRYSETVKTTNRDRDKESTTVELILADNSIHPHKGKIDFVNRNIDATTGTMEVQASFPNPQKTIRPGLFAKAKITFNVGEEFLLIPQKCIREIQGTYNIFVINADNKVEFKEIEVGETIADMWIITSGLKGDEQVVLEGLQQLRSDMVVQPELTQFKSVRNKTQE